MICIEKNYIFRKSLVYDSQSAAASSMIKHNAVILFSDRFRGHNYGPNHPLGIPRVALTLDLISSFARLDKYQLLEAKKAKKSELAGFHTPAYLDALNQCQENRKAGAKMRGRFNLGNFENPFFEDMFDIPATAAGASIQGAEQVIKGRMAFNPAGGMHHAVPDKARGFCYLNDGALGIRRMKTHGWRVLYFDMDAHQGDGVQKAFESDPDVLTVSFHMDTAYAYPRRGGGIDDTGRGGMAVNLPLPTQVNLSLIHI